MPTRASLGALFGLLLLLAVTVGEASATPYRVTAVEYVVVFKKGVLPAAAERAIRASGGTIVRVNGKIGVATALSRNPGFVSAVGRRAVLAGVARSIPVGYSKPELQPSRHARGALALREGLATTRDIEDDPFGHLQWDMKMINAYPDGSYKLQQGDPRVLVGIIDTGIDGSHPDLAPNFSRELSRNFTTDIPLVDGPCEEEPDRSCSDPADVDEGAHGTHVAGTVGAALNGLGIAGVAPKVTLVNLRAGQDSGYFFLQASLDALTYAGDTGIDVVNMSYFIDPWLYNCRSNPGDSPAEQLEQRTVIEATQRALDYARSRGVTLVAALGNDATDLGNPTSDEQSPNFPPGNDRTRTVDNSCLDVPTESEGVISVSALGPSEVKADYSNWGVEQTDVSAPGGFFRDWLSPYGSRSLRNLVLSTYPESVAREFEEIDETGAPTTPFVLRDCEDGICGYYTYFQGTSMAAPHATGVAALIVSQYGRLDRSGGLTLDPSETERILKETARDHACPDPRLFSYAPAQRGPEYDAFCEGAPELNGFYGHGIVDALAAVGGPQEGDGDLDD